MIKPPVTLLLAAAIVNTIACMVLSALSFVLWNHWLLRVNAALVATGFALIFLGMNSNNVIQKTERVLDIGSNYARIGLRAVRTAPSLLLALVMVAFLGGGFTMVHGMTMAGPGKYLSIDGKFYDISVAPAKEVSKSLYIHSNVIGPAQLVGGAGLILSSFGMILLLSARGASVSFNIDVD